MFAVYVVLWCDKKLEKLSKLEISWRSILRVCIGKSRPLEQVQKPIRFRDLEFRTAEKLEKNVIQNYKIIHEILTVLLLYSATCINLEF